MWLKVKKPMRMAYSEDLIRQQSLRHLSNVFAVPAGSLSTNMRFGEDLNASSSSDFGRNEFDVIDGDIKDIADKSLIKQMAQGKLVIVTVGDYCEHMIRCSFTKPEEVANVLGLSGKKRVVGLARQMSV